MRMEGNARARFTPKQKAEPRRPTACCHSIFSGEWIPTGFNRSTQHLLVEADEEVCVWRGMHGHGSHQSRRLSREGQRLAATVFSRGNGSLLGSTDRRNTF